MNDEAYFPSPSEFSPERHMGGVGVKKDFDLDTESFEEDLTQTMENDPSTIVFGFGRR